MFVTTRDQKARRKIIGPTRACEFEGNEADLMLLNTGERHMPTDRLTPGLKAETVTTVDDRLVVAKETFAEMRAENPVTS